MLVLSRKVGERIMIGDTIVLTVVSIDRGKIRLGIEAPKELPVHRHDSTRPGCGSGPRLGSVEEENNDEA